MIDLESIKRERFLMASYKTFQDAIIFGSPYIHSISSGLRTKIYSEIPHKSSAIKIFSFDKKYWLTICVFSDTKEAFSDRTGLYISYGLVLSKADIKRINLDDLFFNLCKELEAILKRPLFKMFPKINNFSLDENAYNEVSDKVNSFSERNPSFKHMKNRYRPAIKIPIFITHPKLLKDRDMFILILGNVMRELICAKAEVTIVVSNNSNDFNINNNIDICICQYVYSYAELSSVKLVKTNATAVIYYYR